MTEFDESRWADSKFSQEYREEADNYIPYRRIFIETIKSFYHCFLPRDANNKVLDLGCGDGLFTQELLKSARIIEAVLVDGSKQMLDAAKERLANHAKIQFINRSFQQLLSEGLLPKDFDFIFSSLAIHHLNIQEKTGLYGFIHDHLIPGGYFINFDVVLSPSEELEKWYLSQWSDWIEHQTDKSKRNKFLPIPQQYKDNKDNMPDTLKSQMEALEKIGFQDVDCYLKHGIFSLFGGRKKYS